MTLTRSRRHSASWKANARGLHRSAGPGHIGQWHASPPGRHDGARRRHDGVQQARLPRAYRRSCRPPSGRAIGRAGARHADQFVERPRARLRSRWHRPPGAGRPARDVTRPARNSAAAAFSSTTSRAGPRVPARTLRTIAALAAASPPGEGPRGRLGHADVGRVQVEGLHRAVVALGYLRVARSWKARRGRRRRARPTRARRPAAPAPAPSVRSARAAARPAAGRAAGPDSSAARAD